MSYTITLTEAEYDAIKLRAAQVEAALLALATVVEVAANTGKAIRPDNKALRTALNLVMVAA